MSDGDGSSSSRELEDEGGEGFYMARTGRPANLHVPCPRERILSTYLPHHVDAVVKNFDFLAE